MHNNFGIGQHVDDLADALTAQDDACTEQLHVELWHTYIEDALEDVHHIVRLRPLFEVWFIDHRSAEALLLAVRILEDIHRLRHLLIDRWVCQIQSVCPSIHVFEDSHRPLYLFG